MGKTRLILAGFKSIRKLCILFFFRIEFFLLKMGIIKKFWASVPYICRGKGRHYCVVEEGYMCIYTTVGYPELFVYGVLILSRKISAWHLLEILFHSPSIPFHLPPTNVVLVTATNKLTDSLTVVRYRSLNAAKESHEIEHYFRPTILTKHITRLIPVALIL